MSIFGPVAPEVRNALDDWMLRAALATTLATYGPSFGRSAVGPTRTSRAESSSSFPEMT